MKKFITLLFILLLVGCQYRNTNEITINRKESNSISTVYDLNDCKNIKIEIYQLLDYEWELMHINQLSEDCSKLSIDFHQNTNDTSSKEIYIQYFTFDKNNNELSEKYAVNFIYNEDLTFHSKKVNNIEYESSQKHVIAIYEWGADSIKQLADVKLNQKHEAKYAYLIVLS